MNLKHQEINSNINQLNKMIEDVNQDSTVQSQYLDKNIKELEDQFEFIKSEKNDKKLYLN